MWMWWERNHKEGIRLIVAEEPHAGARERSGAGCGWAECCATTIVRRPEEDIGPQINTI